MPRKWCKDQWIESTLAHRPSRVFLSTSYGSRWPGDRSFAGKKSWIVLRWRRLFEDLLACLAEKATLGARQAFYSGAGNFLEKGIDFLGAELLGGHLAEGLGGRPPLPQSALKESRGPENDEMAIKP